MDKINKEREFKLINKFLIAKIISNIREKELSGINMGQTKSSLKKYFKGIHTKETVNVYKELLTEANAQLGLLKLDQSYRIYENKIKEVITKDLTELYGKDPNEVSLILNF